MRAATLCSLALLGANTWSAEAPPAANSPVAEMAPTADSPERVTIRGVEFDGNRAVPTEALRGLAAPLIGHTVTPSEIEEFRRLVTRHYIDRGFVNSGAVYADPHLRDGVLRLRIIEGRISELRVTGNERLDSAYFGERLVEDGEVLNMNVLQERFQLLMTDPLLSRMNARILPGSALGEAVLDVQVDRALPWQATVYANNHRPPSTGEIAFGGTALLRNLTGYGDVLDATLQSTRGGVKEGIGWTIPFGLRRPQLSMRFERGNASVIEEPLRRADIDSMVTAREVGVAQPLLVTPRQKLALALTYSARVNTTTIMGEPFSFVAGESSGTSRIKSWRFAQEYLARNDTQVLALRSTFVRGRSNTLDEPADSPVAFPARNYRLWLGQSQFSWKLGSGNLRLVARLDIQSSGDRLVSLEKFAVGGAATVRGYRENSLVRDNGYAGAVELHWPLTLGGAHRLDLFPFVDVGAAWNRGEGRERLQAIGLGASWQYGNWRADLAWGHQLKERPDPEHQTLQDRGLHFQLSHSFN